MGKKLWISAGIVIVVGLLAGAAYLGATLIFPRLGNNPGDQRGGNRIDGYEVLPAPELPQTLPDTVGFIAEVSDSGLMVRRKGSANQGAPLLEVVLTGHTQIYYDVTDGQEAEQHLVDGKIQQAVAAYERQAITVSDIIVAWGVLRGNRLVADVVVVYVGEGETSNPNP